MDFAKFAGLAIADAKALLPLLPTLKADLDAANANPAFKLLLAAYPNLATLDAEAVRVLGELSAIEHRLKPILDLL